MMPKRVIDVYCCWKGLYGWHSNSVMWNVAPHSLICMIWMEWNNQTSKGVERSIIEIKSIFFCLLFEFCTMLGGIL